MDTTQLVKDRIKNTTKKAEDPAAYKVSKFSPT